MAQSTDKNGEAAKADAAKTGSATTDPREQGAKPRAVTKAKPAAGGPVMYLGPNLPQGLLMHGQVYRNGLPAAATDLISRVTGAEALFVPTAGIPKAKLALADRTSALSRLYRAVAESQGG